VRSTTVKVRTSGSESSAKEPTSANLKRDLQGCRFLTKTPSFLETGKARKKKTKEKSNHRSCFSVALASQFEKIDFIPEGNAIAKKV